MELLSRDEFREGVFSRDDHKCVICGEPAQDAHHIIERRLFPDGGYYLDNGASLCGEHHLDAESTELSCETIREAAGIRKVVLPPNFYDDQNYSKWGDVILPNGARMKGPLFGDESVQKILKRGDAMKLYSEYVKYPRTMHLPWSEGVSSDDRVLENVSCFEGKRVVVTEKMDGENTSLYNDYYHARSIDGRNHWSRSWVKNFHAKIKSNIPYGWRVCGENLYAKHSIGYSDLPSFFQCFSIWTQSNNCLSWSETKEWAKMIGVTMVPTLYEGIWDEEIIRELYNDSIRGTCEGYVVRITEGFSYLDFHKSVAKFVRQEHVNTSHHWFFTASEKNEQRTI